MPFGTLRYDRPELVTTDTVYDVASITKSIPTACLALKLIEEGKLSLDEKVIDHVPELQNDYRQDILIRHLLTYTVVFDFPEGLSSIAKARPESVLPEMFKAPLMAPPGKRYYYTNPPAILLGLVMERLEKQTLEEQAQRVFKPLGMSRSTYHVPESEMSQVAPSEVGDRGELQGRVQDETAWALGREGRLGGHAGLFSCAGDLLTFAQMLLAKGTYEGHRYFRPQTVRLMHTNQLPYLKESASLGWEIASAKVMGSKVGPAAFGKTGFAGCNIVIDPEKMAALVILSNRTYPHRQTTRDDINAVRRAVADVVFGD